MSNRIIPSDSDLFPACVEVLSEQLRPMHYKDLTVAAWARLGIRSAQVEAFRSIEDVRERLPSRNKYGVVYTGAPDCLMAKRSWFSHEQLPLFNVDTGVVVIPGNVNSGIGGAFEALMRSGAMLNKFGSSVEDANMRRSKGLVVEKHVSDWFEKKWSQFFSPAENNKQWTKSCSHDFMLTVGSVQLKVDVAGVNYDGLYGNRGNKKTTDLHLLCRISGNNVVWEAVAKGVEFNSVKYPEEAMSPINMMVWLNCMANNIDYNQFVKPRQSLDSIAA